MNKTVLKLKQHVLSTSLGQVLRDAWHNMHYTMAEARKAAICYYGDDSLAKDMLDEARRHEVLFFEYRMYHFENLSDERRRSFIPLREAIKYIERLSPYKDSYLFYSKGETYRHFREYYKRDVIEIENFTESEKYRLKEMAECHKCLMFKPYDGAEGRGIMIKDFRNASLPIRQAQGELDQDKTFETIWNSIRQDYKHGCVVEEIVKQSKEMNEIIPDVVNTLRVGTIVLDDRVEVVGTCWRCGRKGKVVDNGGSGGLVCGLDEKGVIVAVIAEDGTEYTTHPDTGKRLIGFQIPEYKEALEFSRKLAMVCPQVRYVGWDLALTDAGWIMIEGNADAHFGGWQIPLQTGFRPIIDPLMKELGLKI